MSADRRAEQYSNILAAVSAYQDTLVKRVENGHSIIIQNRRQSSDDDRPIIDTHAACTRDQALAMIPRVNLFRSLLEKEQQQRLDGETAGSKLVQLAIDYLDGDTPQEVTVFIPSKDIEENFRQARLELPTVPNLTIAGPKHPLREAVTVIEEGRTYERAVNGYSTKIEVASIY